MAVSLGFFLVELRIRGPVIGCISHSVVKPFPKVVSSPLTIHVRGEICGIFVPGPGLEHQL